METLARLCAADEELLLATVNKLVDLCDSQSEQDGCHWWSELTGRGGEGMGIKPLAFIGKGKSICLALSEVGRKASGDPRPRPIGSGDVAATFFPD